MTRPPLSVVVAITSGESHIDRCLAALHAQEGAPEVEIIVPVYGALDDVPTLRRRWPRVCFTELEDSPPADPALRHWQYDRRRAAGLAAADGEIVAITEDHAIPRPDWCASVLRAHVKPHPAIGGAIRHTGSTWLDWAVFLCDFGRYQPPFPPGPAAYISDINVSYKRSALESCRDLWRDFYHETAIHGHFRDSGLSLWLTPEVAVDYDRGRLSLRQLLPERFAWARVFAGRRAGQLPWSARAALAFLSPGLPILLAARRVLSARRPNLAASLGALPLMLLLLAAWSAGECAGYCTARPFSRPLQCPAAR